MSAAIVAYGLAIVSGLIGVLVAEVRTAGRYLALGAFVGFAIFMAFTAGLLFNG